MDRTVDQHRDVTVALVSPLPIVSVQLAKCLHLGLARDVVAPMALPPFDNSAMDGYAVRAIDVADPPVRLSVIADLPAGVPALTPLAPGTAHRIMTGAQVPAGADAIVEVELTDAGIDIVTVRESVARGRSIRRAGEDVAMGDVVLRTGDRMTPKRIAVAAGLGLAEIAVHRRPRVAVFATGDELQQPGSSLAPGAIFDSNSFVVSACARAANVDVVETAVLTDDVASAARRLREVAGDVDLIITTGGVSAGAYEVIKQALVNNADVQFVTVAVQPGKPQGAGLIDGTPLLALPGNPVSAFVSFELFVRPVLDRLGGIVPEPIAPLLALTARSIARRHDRRQYLLGQWSPAGGTVGRAAPIGSHRVGALAQANCLIMIEQGVGDVPSGAQVGILPIA